MSMLLAELGLHGQLPLFSNNGSTRRIYDAGNCVVKINKSDSWQDNAIEWENYQDVFNRELPPVVRLPWCEFYQIDGNDIIVMQKIEGQLVRQCSCYMEECDDWCLPEPEAIMLASIINDLSGLNVIYDGTSYWPIDFG